MSANRERNFHNPSIGSLFSGRERYYVKVIDRQTGRVLLETGSSGEAVINGDSLIVHHNRTSNYGKKNAFSLQNVDVQGDYVRFAGEQK